MVKRLTTALLALAIVLSVSGCADEETPRLELTGSVVDATTVVPVPRMPALTPDLDAGLGETEPTASPFASGADAMQAASRAATMRWARVASVAVRPGDVVQSGQELARLEDTTARIAVASAKAAAASAKAGITLLDERLGDVTEGRSELSTKAVDLDKTITDLESQRADIANQLAAAKATLANPPSTAPTATPAPGTPTLPQQIASLEAALAQLEAGLEQARTGRSTLTSATAELDTVQSRIAGLRTAANAVLEAREIGVNIARQQLDDTIVLAPAAGTIVSAPLAGEILASGAPFVELRTSWATRVETYVTAQEARRMTIGTQALVSVDALPGRGQPAHVTFVGDKYEFVPTTFATKIIHLTRGLRVVVELDGTRWIAPGTPADVEISVK